MQPGWHGAIRNVTDQYGIEHPEAVGGLAGELVWLDTSRVSNGRNGVKWLRGRQAARSALTREGVSSGSTII